MLFPIEPGLSNGTRLLFDLLFPGALSNKQKGCALYEPGLIQSRAFHFLQKLLFYAKVHQAYMMLFSFQVLVHQRGACKSISGSVSKVKASEHRTKSVPLKG